MSVGRCDSGYRSARNVIFLTAASFERQAETRPLARPGFSKRKGSIRNAQTFTVRHSVQSRGGFHGRRKHGEQKKTPAAMCGRGSDGKRMTSFQKRQTLTGR
jgi:hypothetical protein